MLISGGTGSGKTTLLNALSSSIPNNERIVTIEDAAELQLHQRHVLRLEARPPNIEGEGHIPIRDLVRNSLRMRPDRIIVGEVRGAEALDMLQAMNTGHDGSLSTVHSNSPRDGLHRIETMVMMAGYDLPLRAIRQHIAAALDLLVHIDRMEDGSRRVVAVTEVLRMESDVIQLQDIFEFEIEAVAPDRTITGGLKPTGLRPVFLDKFRKRGIELPQSHVRRARPLSRRAPGRNGVKLRLRITIASAAVAALALPTLALGQGAPRRRSPSRRRPGSRTRRSSSRCGPTQAAHHLAGRRHGERPARHRPRRRSSGRLGERRDPAHRRVEQHEGRADRERDGRRRARSSRERKDDLPVAIVVFGPDDRRPLRLHDEQGGARRRGRRDAGDVRGNAHLRRAHRTPRTRRRSKGLERTTVVLLSDGTDFGSERLPRRGAAGSGRRERPRHLGRSQLAAVRPGDAEEPRRTGRAARTSRRRRRPSSSRSSTRSASSSRASTRSRTARSSRPSRRQSSS